MLELILSVFVINVTLAEMIYFDVKLSHAASPTEGVLHCDCSNVIYLIICKNCLEQYVVSAIKDTHR